MAQVKHSLVVKSWFNDEPQWHRCYKLTGELHVIGQSEEGREGETQVDITMTPKQVRVFFHRPFDARHGIKHTLNQDQLTLATIWKLMVKDNILQWADEFDLYWTEFTLDGKRIATVDLFGAPLSDKKVEYYNLAWVQDGDLITTAEYEADSEDD